MHKGPSDVIVDSDIIGCKYKNVVGHGTYFEIEDVVKLVDFLGLFFEGRCSELSDFFLANETF
jgi:hypothetical protein